MSIPENCKTRKPQSGNAFDANGYRPDAEVPTALYVPNSAGLSLLNEALAYAEAGWYVLPTNPGDIKNPGSVVGGSWPEQSSREPEQIRAWWTENPNYGIALHVGRSGAVAFDLDIDSLVVIRAEGRGDVADALANAGAIQGTRRSGDRGHYVFLMPPAEQVGNGAGAFMRWGQVRGKNGVIIAAPTPHPDADGDYHWTSSGCVTALPKVLRDCLSEAAESNDPLTDAELEAFLDTYQGGGCGRADCRHKVSGPVKQFEEHVANGASRHDTMLKVAPWAMSEAMAGCYPAREAFGKLYSTYSAAFNGDGDRARVTQLGDEYQRIAKWAAAQADPDRAHRNDDLLTADDLEAFWSARPELSDLRQFARARRVGPWAMLGHSLAMVIGAIPPEVVLPPTIGDYASLNMFVALVGRSGETKSAAMRAAKAWLSVDPEPNPKKPGSGEGLAKCYAYVQKSKGPPAEQVGIHWTVLAEIPEVETLTAVAKRGGANIMSELRNGWTGERLGHDYAAAEKAIVLCDHRYRLCMTIGVQPLKAGPILGDADAGTPQRFVWFPVDDPDCPEDRPPEPPRYELPAWPMEVAPDDVIVLDRNDFLASRLNVRVDPADFEVLGIPEAARNAIDAHQLAKLRGDPNVDPLDGHKLLCCLKVAAGLMRLNGRTDKITDEDWGLAGVVMRVSDATRAEVQAALRTKASVANKLRGRAEGERAIAAEDVKRDRTIARIADGIREKLRVENHQKVNRLSKRFSGPERHNVWPALKLLEKVGDIWLEPIDYQGNPGHIAHLKEGR